MRSLWKVSNHKLGGYPAIELRTTCLGHENVEYCLSGPRGEIWEVTIGQDGLSRPGCTPRYAAIVTHGLNGQLSAYEQLVRFGEVELSGWVDRLGIPATSEEQTPFANTFKRRTAG